MRGQARACALTRAARNADNRGSTGSYALTTSPLVTKYSESSMHAFFQRLVLRVLLGCALAALLNAPAIAQTTSPTPFRIAYQLTMPRPASHLFQVNMEIALPTPTEFVDLQMPKWSPGRYAVFDFAKNVQEFRAVSGICLPTQDCSQPGLPITRIDDQTWRVATRGTNSLTVSYKVFGDDLSGTFAQLDARHANYNGGEIFMYVVGHKPDPVTLKIDPPANWRIVNGRTSRTGQREWQFPNYDIMIDTPTEIAPDWTQNDFSVDGKNYHVVVHSFGDEGGKRPALVRDIERIVRAETAMWGAPEFDSYTFLIHFAADDRSGDGMEHLTSTQVIQPGALADPGTYEDTLDTVAHEFFHVWNVKRLRPIELGPWDFTRPANTRGLWIAEGFTNYYGHLMLRRAGLLDDARFLQRESQTITNVENAPGSRLMSAVESSLSAPFLDRGTSIQRTNLLNTAISYYPKGELLALTLDLLIRGRTNGAHSLDYVMRRMYEEFYLKSPNASYYLRGRGYTNEDFARVASEVAGINLEDFFARYANGVETPPYNEALAHVGLQLLRAPSEREPYTAGITLERDETPQPKIASIRNGSSAEDAGLNRGDVILSIGNERVTPATWTNALNRFKQGARVPFTVQRDRRTIQTFVTLGAPDVYTYRIEEKKDATPQSLALRAAWLNGKRP
ncbi:MAG: M61 family metallopeptidase [Pyrinomonadaceae bacterium]